MKYQRKYLEYKERAIALRRRGRTYRDIQEDTGIAIPPSTLSGWFRGIVFEREEKECLVSRINEKLVISRIKISEKDRLKIAINNENIYQSISHLRFVLNDKDVAKTILAMLYWCEGSKKRRGSLCFGNSDSGIIRLFLSLLRQCYSIDESKFRITVQCRADQDTEALESYWFKVTKVQRGQFYASQIDPRTVGKPTRKASYKGVCRIDYFSADVYNELQVIAQLFNEGPVV